MNKIKCIFTLLLVLSFNSFALASPQQLNNYIQSAYKSYNNGNYQAAIENYKQAVKLSPNNFDIRYNLGVIYSRINDFNNAELCYKKAIQLKPTNPKPYLNLGNIYLNKKQYNQAVECFEKYTSFVPSDALAFGNLGVAYDNIGKNQLAIKNYEKALQLKPNDYITLYNIANSYARAHQYQKAIFYYQKALNIKKDDKIYSNLGTVCLGNGDYKLAIESFKSAMDLNPDNTRAKEGLSLALIKYNQDIANKNIINLIPAKKAPPELYKLVKSNFALKYKDTLDKTYEILDFLWVDENGKILLTQIMKNKIPIQITHGKANTNAKTEETTMRQTFIQYGGFPSFTMDIEQDKKITVNIGEEIIQLYKNPSSSFNQNMYAIMAVMHEFGHAAASIVEEKHNNSLEEELTVSMIGYNSASKVLTGKLLTKEESISYAKRTFKSLMSDDHKNLPLYNDFEKTISKLGITLYNYDTYSDFYGLQQETLQ